MSEPIQSISQGNYILHNIDAKKLYVQEPLFTANSGDAVYVGWRPDETVLWSGNATIGTELTLSEPFSAFDRIRIMNGHQGWYERPSNVLTGDQDGFYEFSYVSQMMSQSASEFGYEHYCVLYSGHDNKLKATSALGYVINKSGQLSRTVNTNNYSTRTYQVVGINRKENA